MLGFRFGFSFPCWRPPVDSEPPPDPENSADFSDAVNSGYVALLLEDI